MRAGSKTAQSGTWGVSCGFSSVPKVRKRQVWLSQIEKSSSKHTTVSRYRRLSVFPSNLTQHLPSLGGTGRCSNRLCRLRLGASFRLPYRTPNMLRWNLDLARDTSEIPARYSAHSSGMAQFLRACDTANESSRRDAPDGHGFKQKWFPYRLHFST